MRDAVGAVRGRRLAGDVVEIDERIVVERVAGSVEEREDGSVAGKILGVGLPGDALVLEVGRS